MTSAIGDEDNKISVSEVELRTFAFGRFPLLAFDAVANWECVQWPTDIEGAVGFTTLACGHCCCFGITPEGDAHRWDTQGPGSVSRSFGVELSLSSLKDEDGQKLQFRDVAIEPSGVAVALTDRGDVYATDQWFAAELGEEGDASFPFWRAVSSLQFRPVVSVACGSGFSMALTAHGELFAWGKSSYGCLGLGVAALSATVPTPQLISSGLHPFRIAAVACGDNHVVAAAVDDSVRGGLIFSWGCSLDYRLGYVPDNASGDVQPEPREVPWLTPELSEALAVRRRESDERVNSIDRQLRKHRLLSVGQRISQVACGSRHSVVLFQGGIVCFGSDDCRQLGRQYEKSPLQYADSAGELWELPTFAFAPALTTTSADEESSPKMQCWRELEARRVSCGALHTAALSSEGHLFVWGFDVMSEQTYGGDQDHVGPWREKSRMLCGGVRQIDGFGPKRPVVALACGPYFVVVSAEVPTGMRDLFVGSQSASSGCLSHNHSFGDSTCDDSAAFHWRPANLPRKSEAETSKHRAMVQDLERHVQRRLEREHQEELDHKAREKRRERRLQEHTQLWLQELLPCFVPGSQPSRRMQRYWRQGLPPRVREKLWPMAIGNVLRITPELFSIHRQQAQNNRGAECIPTDLPRTFPTLAFFCEGGPLHEDCRTILEAYSNFRPDIGYVQGMSYLAAMLLLYMPIYPAFVGLCNLLNSPSIFGLYRLVPSAVDRRARVFHKLCVLLLPAVARVIDEAGMTPHMFLLDWFMTLYAKCLPIDAASVVWDLFLLDGEIILYCTAIAMLRISEAALLERGMDDLEACSKILGAESMRRNASEPDELLWHIQEVWRRSPPQLIAEIRSIENTEFSSTLPHGTKERSFVGSGHLGFRGAKLVATVGSAAVSVLDTAAEVTDTLVHKLKVGTQCLESR